MLLCAPTHRRSRFGPRAPWQAAQTIGACGISALTTIGWGSPNPFAPGFLAGGLVGLLLPSPAPVLGRGGGRRGSAPPLGAARFPPLPPPIRIVARRRA